MIKTATTLGILFAGLSWQAHASQLDQQRAGQQLERFDFAGLPIETTRNERDGVEVTADQAVHGYTGLPVLRVEGEPAEDTAEFRYTY